MTTVSSTYPARPARSHQSEANLRKAGRIAVWVLRAVVLLAVAFVMLLPFAWAVGTSFKPTSEVVRYPPTIWPEHFNGLAAYEHVVTKIPFIRYFLNSLTVAVTVTLSCAFTSTLAGYIFEKFRFRGRQVLFFLVIATMMVPSQVTLIPVYLLVRNLHLTNTLWALIVPALVNAWGIFLLRQSMKSIPGDLLDAARIDGASEMGIFIRIVLPMSQTALAALAVFIFMASWNDFLWPLIVLDDMQVRTLQVGLAAFSGALGNYNWNIIMAGVVLSVLPIILVFVLAQRRLIEGMTLGSVKG